MQIVNGHILMLSFGLMCLMIGGGAFLGVKATRDLLELLGRKKVCGKINSGVACKLPKGSKCPDCGISLHDFGGTD